jgi:hypothetical protein
MNAVEEFRHCESFGQGWNPHFEVGGGWQTARPSSTFLQLTDCRQEIELIKRVAHYIGKYAQMNAYIAV